VMAIALVPFWVAWEHTPCVCYQAAMGAYLV
jgi:hypothetical protein